MTTGRTGRKAAPQLSAGTAAVAQGWDAAFAAAAREHDGRSATSKQISAAVAKRRDREAKAAAKDAEEERAAFWKRDCFEPHAWLIVPAFDVKPETVKFVGFSGPVLYRGNPRVSDHVRSLVRIARNQLQQDARGMAVTEVQRLADAAPAIVYREWNQKLPQRQRAALLYATIIRELHRSMIVPPAEAMAHIAFAADLLSTWAVDGTTAAAMRAKKSLEGARKGGRESGITRRLNAVDPEKVEAEARKLGWPAVEWGVQSRLARKFKRSARRIGQILEERQQKG